MTSNLYQEIAALNERIAAADIVLSGITATMPQRAMFASVCRARERLATGWPDKAGDSELFDRISEHIAPDYTDDIAIKNICADFQRRLNAALVAEEPQG